jgi:glutamate synthase (NADPH/NADH) large chain
MARPATARASTCRSRRPFFYDQVVRTGHEPRKDELMAVGQVFLPRTDFGAQETCRTIVETEVLRMGYYIYGWRHVPVT